MIKKSLSLEHELLPAKNHNEKQPLLLMLHGFGSNEEDLFSMAPMLNQNHLIVSARAPINLPWGGHAWYEIDFDNKGGKMSNIPQAKQSMKLILDFIEEVHQAYGTDKENVSLLGFSQGSILSYGLALSYPQLFKNIIALSGYVLKDIVPAQYRKKELAHLKIFASHGTQDEVLPVAWARQGVKVLEQLEIKLEYHEYEMGHGVNQDCFNDVQRWWMMHGR